MKEYDDKYYQDFVFTDKAKRGMPPQMRAIQQENIRKNKDIDDEIARLVTSQDTDTKQHIYNIIREIVALRQQSNSSVSVGH